MWQALLMEGLLMHVLLMESTPGLKKEKNKCYFSYGRCCSMPIKGYAGFEVAALLSREQITPGLKMIKINVAFHVTGAAPWQLMVVQVSKLYHCSLVIQWRARTPGLVHVVLLGP
jgi:acetolactate synthase regulatory subunit